MLCDICHKNEATVHYTEIVHNQMIKMDLCEECAKVKGVGVQSPFSISDLLSGLAEMDAGANFEDPVCKCCGLSFTGFRKSGRLGCAECYETFKVPLESLIKTIHKSSKHAGKQFGMHTVAEQHKFSDEEKLNQLKQKLHLAVEKEEYELAAQLRDQIKEIEKELNNG